MRGPGRETICLVDWSWRSPKWLMCSVKNGVVGNGPATLPEELQSANMNQLPMGV